MAIPLQVNDLTVIRVYCFFESQLSVNTFAYALTAVSPTSTIEGFSTAIEILIGSRWKPCIAKGAMYHGIHVQVLRTGQRFRSVFRNGSAGVGTTTNTGALPKQTCGIVTKLTDFGGPEGRGRLYVPFPYIDGTASQTGPTNAQQVNMNAIGSFVCTNSSVGPVGEEVTTQAVLVNRKTSQRTNIIGSRTSTLWATQRRRSDYSSPNVAPAW